MYRARRVNTGKVKNKELNKIMSLNKERLQHQTNFRETKR